MMVLNFIVVLGFTTDGEFNSLCWKGRSRPLTLLEIRSAVRSTYQRKGLKSLMKMLIFNWYKINFSMGD